MKRKEDFERRLQLALGGNAAFSVVSGCVLLFAAPWFARQFGYLDPLWVRIVGGLVVLFGIDVYYSSRRRLNAVTGFIVSAADAGWVIATFVLLALYWPQIPATGRTLALAVAAMVALFGVLQFRASVGIRHGAAVSGASA